MYILQNCRCIFLGVFVVLTVLTNVFSLYNRVLFIVRRFEATAIIMRLINLIIISIINVLNC